VRPCGAAGLPDIAILIAMRGGDIVNRPKSITNEQAAAIASKLELKDRLIFQLAIETGIRISDLVRLRVSDVHRNPLEVYESKSKRVRLIDITERLQNALKEYAPYRMSFPHGNSSNFVFKGIRSHLKPYSRMTYHRRLKKASQALKIEFSAHSARKLYARNVFERTGDIFAVQQALHHRYVQTTCTYLDIDLTELIKAATQS
jgi:integrase